MPEIPTEIWLYIASFIPNDDLPALMGVNILFYNLALDIRYRQVRIGTVSASTERLLHRLKDPAVASRVRRLIIRPALNLHMAEASAPPSLWQRVTGWKQQTPPPSIERVIESLILIFPALINLAHFEVESWDMSPDYNLQHFFSDAWSAFGHQLQGVSMAGRPEAFRQFVASKPELTSCTSLGLQFTHEIDTTAGSAVVGILVDSVAPFINSLAPQLDALQIWSWSTLDLSALFNNLGVFPRLRDFHLRAPFNKAFPDATGLTTLLDANSHSLEVVELRLNPAGSAMDPSSERVLAQWFSSHAAHDAVLTNLKRLRMYPTTLETGFDALRMYTQRSVNTLKDLGVKDRYLDLEEVKALIAPFSDRPPDEGLQTLRLNVRVWNAELFELFALKLHGLKSLSLYVGGSQPHRAATELFFTSLQSDSLKTWKLHDIGIWQGGSEVPSGTMKLLANCIPSVQSFWGNGHMFGECKIYA
ncbi:hypothetical protein C8R43DRAFT_981070 [Mycena crocata]|nr:hypothetical protein C8R43DRAFT_981070 [Mycena crocata]